MTPWREYIRKLCPKRKYSDVMYYLEGRLDPDGLGTILIRTQDGNYDYRFYDVDAVKAFIDEPKTTKLENAIRRETIQRLYKIAFAPEAFGDTFSPGIVAAAMSMSIVDIFRKRIDSKLNITKRQVKHLSWDFRFNPTIADLLKRAKTKTICEKRVNAENIDNSNPTCQECYLFMREHHVRMRQKEIQSE